MNYAERVRDWFRKAKSGDKMLVRRMYCMRDHRITEHEYRVEDIDGVEWYKEYMCLQCGLITGYGRVKRGDDEEEV